MFIFLVMFLHWIFFNINVFVMKKPWQRLQDASRDLRAELPEKLSTSTPRAKAALNAKDGHTKCWFNLIDKENLFVTLSLTASSFYSIFTQVPIKLLTVM